MPKSVKPTPDDLPTLDRVSSVAKPLITRRSHEPLSCRPTRAKGSCTSSWRRGYRIFFSPKPI